MKAKNNYEYQKRMNTGRYGFDVTPCMNKRCKDEIVSGLGRRLYSLQQKAFSPGVHCPGALFVHNAKADIWQRILTAG